MLTRQRLLGSLQAYLVALQENLVRLAVAVAGTTDAQVLHQAEVGHLVPAQLLVPLGRNLLLVRLDAANVEGRLCLREWEGKQSVSPSVRPAAHGLSLSRQGALAAPVWARTLSMATRESMLLRKLVAAV